MFDRARIVSVARRWIGTPYHHQASSIGVGSDCLGLVRGIWRECFGQEPEVVPAYSMDWSEPQGVEELWHSARRHLVEKPMGEICPGDVLLFRMRSNSVAKHVGIAAENGKSPSFIHAYSGHGVVESPLSDPWKRRVVTLFEFPLEVL